MTERDQYTDNNLADVLSSCADKIGELQERLVDNDGVEFPNAIGKANEIEAKIDELVGEIETALEE